MEEEEKQETKGIGILAELISKGEENDLTTVYDQAMKLKIIIVNHEDLTMRFLGEKKKFDELLRIPLHLDVVSTNDVRELIKVIDEILSQTILMYPLIAEQTGYVANNVELKETETKKCEYIGKCKNSKTNFMCGNYKGDHNKECKNYKEGKLPTPFKPPVKKETERITKKDLESLFQKKEGERKIIALMGFLVRKHPLDADLVREVGNAWRAESKARLEPLKGTTLQEKEKQPEKAKERTTTGSVGEYEDTLQVVSQKEHTTGSVGEEEEDTTDSVGKDNDE